MNKATPVHGRGCGRGCWTFIKSTCRLAESRARSRIIDRKSFLPKLDNALFMGIIKCQNYFIPAGPSRRGVISAIIQKFHSFRATPAYLRLLAAPVSPDHCSTFGLNASRLALRFQRLCIPLFIAGCINGRRGKTGKWEN